MGKTQVEHKIISKKLKYGRLQKLKWYCEICQHQCNNEQSFRQHVQSDKHRVMMSHFRANSNKILMSNSTAFKNTFLDVLRRMFPNREVAANVVYIQVIKDKNHVHMNSTIWESLHGFCNHLYNHGIIDMRMTERGPIIKYKGKESQDLQKENIEKQSNIEFERENKIIQEILNNQSQQENKQEVPIQVEEQKVDTIIQVNKKQQNKKVSTLFSTGTKL